MFAKADASLFTYQAFICVSNFVFAHFLACLATPSLNMFPTDAAKEKGLEQIWKHFDVGIDSEKNGCLSEITQGDFFSQYNLFFSGPFDLFPLVLTRITFSDPSFFLW